MPELPEVETARRLIADEGLHRPGDEQEGAGHAG
jgi:hypothetical protein